MAQTAPLPEPTPIPQPSPRSERDRERLRWRFAFPLYLRNAVDTYMEDHPRNTVATVLLRGLAALGIGIDEADLTPERAARGPRKRQQSPADALDKLTVSSFDIPRYVRVGVEDYMRQHPDMGLRNVAMAGLKALGIDVRDVDLTTQEPNILADGNRTSARRSSAQTPTDRNATRAA